MTGGPTQDERHAGGLHLIASVALVSRVLDALRSAIITGELAAGEPLRDRRLAEVLGVSRTPVREALHRLEATGLVETKRRSGWAVSDFTEKDVRELFQLRRALEPLGLEGLEGDPDPAAIGTLGSFFQDYSHPVDEKRYEEYFASDHAFHKLIVTCSRNSRLEHLYSMLELHIDRGRHFLTTAAFGRADETLDEHLAISRAVRERDFVGARDDLLRHLRTGEDLMIERLRERAATR